MTDRIYHSLIGFITADAVGVPIEFKKKEEIEKMILTFAEKCDQLSLK